MSEPKDWKSSFDQLNEAGLPDHFLSEADRGRRPAQERDLQLDEGDEASQDQDDDLWNPADYDDEPRTDGKSALDLFRESCKAADRERREELDGSAGTPKS